MKLRWVLIIQFVTSRCLPCGRRRLLSLVVDIVVALHDTRAPLELTHRVVGEEVALPVFVRHSGPAEELGTPAALAVAALNI